MPSKAAACVLALAVALAAAAALQGAAPRLSLAPLSEAALLPLRPLLGGLVPWPPSWQSAAGRHSPEAEERHHAKRLPGWGTLDFLLYSGQVPVSKDKALFYATVEAEHRPDKAPVVLWLTGGPGCSSVGTAFLGEHGPLLMSPGSTHKLIRNPWSYHAFANMIYLDAPAFVGFSYSNNTGHYVPHIALKLLKRDKDLAAAAGDATIDAAGYAAVASSHHDRIDFRGFLLGNPSTDSEYDNEGRLLYWWSHGLISEDIKREVEDTCDFREVIITPSIEVKTRKESRKCRKAVEDAIAEMGPINIQNVFGDKCLEGSGRTRGSRSGGVHDWRGATAEWLSGKRRRHEEVDPCISQEVEAYLARRDVQDALHANLTGQLCWEYKGCTEASILKYSNDDQLESMLPLYRNIMEKDRGLRILIYTGDADGLVPLTGTRRWVFELGTEEGKKKKTHWRHWEDEEGQVGGFLEEYEGFTFATIRRAGHEAPYTARGRTFFIYKAWLSGRDIV